MVTAEGKEDALLGKPIEGVFLNDDRKMVRAQENLQGPARARRCPGLRGCSAAYYDSRGAGACRDRGGRVPMPWRLSCGLAATFQNSKAELEHPAAWDEGKPGPGQAVAAK